MKISDRYSQLLFMALKIMSCLISRLVKIHIKKVTKPYLKFNQSLDNLISMWISLSYHINVH